MHKSGVRPKHLRVAMIAPPWLSVPPNGYGGIEVVLVSLVPELIKLGVDVELFTVGDSTLQSTKNHWLYESGQYGYVHRPHYDTLPILAGHMLFALNAIKKDGGFDIIHNHNPYIGPAMLAYSDHSLPPAIHTVHGPPFNTADRLELGIPDNLPMWYQLGVSDRLYFIGISRALMHNAPRVLKRQTLTPVYNGIDVEQFPFVDKKDDYFITLARFHPDKGQEHAIKACLSGGYRLKMSGVVGDMARPKDVMMELANPLSSYRSLTDFRYFSDRVFPYLDDQIEYLGDLGGQRKMKFISQAKALLFPIQWDEPFGVAPIEALACGTPVVAMARGALPEIIKHGVNGFLARDSREFRQYMKRVGEIDPADCRKSVEQSFSAHTMAKNYLKAYQKVIAKHQLNSK